MDSRQPFSCMYAACLLILVLPQPSASLDNGLVRTPPMGWMNWERFRCNIDCDHDPENCVSEKLFMDMADRMSADGFLEAGYTTVCIDDCWMSKERDAEGKLVADPKRFPSGIKHLADYVHSKGLKLGIYEDFGKLTCGGYPGSLGHLATDAETFAMWGVDELKLDGCYSNAYQMAVGYPEMGHYLNRTGRPIVYSCSWPAYLLGKQINYSEIAYYCNMWRNYYDIQDSWDSVTNIIDYYAKNYEFFGKYTAPGQWNDPDMLIVGDFSLSYEESKAQFAIWSMLAAPLIMSNDLRAISTEAKEILLNKEVIAVNQDPLGKQGRQISKNGNLEVWAKPLKNGSVAVVLFNRSTGGIHIFMEVKFAEVGLTGEVSVRDLYAQEDRGVFSDSFGTFVNPSGGVVMLKLTSQEHT